MSGIVDTIRRQAPEEEVAATAGVPRRRGDPDLGVVQYFHLGDHETAERVLDELTQLGARRLRTAISWCDWTRPGGEDWYGWLLPLLLERFDVLPCFLYTPPELGLLPKTSSPPRDPQAYGEFVAMVLDRHSGAFPYVELWNEPNNYIEWDWTVDPEWVIFAEMIGGAAERAARAGVRSVLGGMSPFDPNWLDLMYKRGALEHVDVIGVHGFPGTWEAVWEGWDTHIGRVQEVVDRHGSEARVWVTEAGFSTWANDEFRQLTTMVELAEAPAERAYWYSVEDLAPERQTLDGFHCDERAYHFGLHRRSGEPKLLTRLLRDRGLDGVREMVAFAQAGGGPSATRPGALVTGGAGSVGAQLVDRLASGGTAVTVLDSLARPGAEESLRALKERHGELVRAEIGDVRDVFALRRSLAHCDCVFNVVLADSGDPRTDLAVNLEGTINALEEVRALDRRPAFVHVSRTPFHLFDPHSASKNAADHYVRSYARSYGLRACVLRVAGDDPGPVVDAALAAAADESALGGRALSVDAEPARPGGARSGARFVPASRD